MDGLDLDRAISGLFPQLSLAIMRTTVRLDLDRAISGLFPIDGKALRGRRYVVILYEDR